MKINHQAESANPSSLQRTNAAQEHANASARDTRATRRLDRDSVSLSLGSGQLQQLSTKLTTLDELDTASIERIRPEVEAGSYPVDTARLAKSIVDLESSLQKP